MLAVHSHSGHAAKLEGAVPWFCCHHPAPCLTYPLVGCNKGVGSPALRLLSDNCLMMLAMTVRIADIAVYKRRKDIKAAAQLHTL